MAKLQKIELIYTEEKLAGDGKVDPYRRVHQWFTTEGTLVLEYDPHTDQTSMIANLIPYLRGLK